MSAKVMKTTLYVQNMTCVNCEDTIEQSLMGIAGIEHVKASYSKGTVLISYDPSLIQLPQIEGIIESHDYYVQNEEDNEKNLELIQSKSSTNLTNILGGFVIIISLYIIVKQLGLMDIIYSFPIAKEGIGYTGSPVKGAISMFLFSVGAVLLMFAFNKKLTRKMMKVSAALVVLLGIVMFSTGASLSGLNIPSFQAVTGQAQASNVATIRDGVQYVTTELTFGGYEPIVVQSGLPVQWTIKAEEGTVNGCNNSIVIPKFNLQQDLAVGETMIEFTPIQSGTVPYSCWMGMIRSKITVVDDLDTVDSDAISSDDSGIAGANNLTDDILIDYEIEAEELAIGEIGEDGIQKVEITLDENGFSPAAIVVQRDLETVWVINGKDVEGINDNIVLFPVYYAQLTLIEGENPITFYPEQDFDFLTSDTNLYGYVKVVDNINTIDVDAIRKEISEYRPTDFYAGGGGLPSCH